MPPCAQASPVTLSGTPEPGLKERPSPMLQSPPDNPKQNGPGSRSVYGLQHWAGVTKPLTYKKEAIKGWTQPVSLKQVEPS